MRSLEFNGLRVVHHYDHSYLAEYVTISYLHAKQCASILYGSYTVGELYARVSPCNWMYDT